MNIRQNLQDGVGRLVLTILVPIVVFVACYKLWPASMSIQEKWLSGFQKIAFVAAAFAVTAYNLRTRVVDFALRIEGKPARVDEFCRIARNCGKRLTGLVLLFVLTSLLLGALTLFEAGTQAARIACTFALAVFSASVISFVYIIFSFERLERFALDEAEKNARKKEADRLFKSQDPKK